jgi:hypothetical protein
MVTLAFWNLRQKPLYDLVAGLCASYWHSFDQALLRPDLYSEFSHFTLEVITQITNQSLLKNHRISNQFSDHLPIVLKLIREETKS